MNSFLQTNETYGNFIVTDCQTIQELSLDCIQLVHKKTGACVVHLKNEDPENVFCISLQTLPQSCNGVAHILEHTVLCGSKKFPVKDPFFAMIRRSLHTFMNAFTGMDFTCYPASSENVIDFYNLFEVYLDSVFFPNLTQESFLQEGHRLEFLEKENPNTPLIYRGIVFNEMKGSMSSMESRFWQHLFAHLLPDLPYKHNSGGDPAKIPFLTHRELVEFHQNFYTPSNAIFYFYGNIPTKKHLDFLEKNLLTRAQKTSVQPPVCAQPRFSQPVFVEKPYPAKKQETSVLGFAFLTAPIHKVDTILALTLLESILCDTDASLLKKPLLDFGIKTVDAYFETDMSEAPFILVCKGFGKKSPEQIREKLFSTLADIAKKPIPEKKVVEALHALEFSRKEISNAHYPYGLHLFMRAVLPKQHGINPIAALKTQQLFTTLQNQAKNPEFFAQLIHEYFLDNPHFVQLILTPSETLIEEEEKLERNTLDQIQNHLSSVEKKRLVESAKTLEKQQERLEKASLNCLPKIAVKEVNPKAKNLSLEKNATFYKEIFTNQIIYIDGCIPLPQVAEKELRFLSLFAEFFTEVGTKKRNFAENLSFINANLGGFEAYFSLNIQAKNPEKMAPFFVIRTKALYRNTKTLCHFLQEMLEEVDFSDEKRIEDLLAKEFVELKTQIVGSAMHYAQCLCRSHFKASSYFYDLLYGFRYFQTIEELMRNPKKSAQYLATLFTKWKKTFFQQPIDWIITGDKQQYKQLEKEHFFGLLERKKIEQPAFDFPNIDFASQKSEAWTIPSAVAFSALSLPAVEYTNTHCPGLLAAAELMQNTILHKEIREKGGAYGSGAHFDPIRADITFRAYRDPHLFSSVKIFEKAIEKIQQASFTNEDLDDAILGVIQYLDQPISPGSQGLTAYLRYKKGISATIYQNLRTQLLNLDIATVQKAANSLPRFSNAILVSFCNHAFFTKENEKTSIPLPIRKL